MARSVLSRLAWSSAGCVAIAISAGAAAMEQPMNPGNPGIPGIPGSPLGDPAVVGAWDPPQDWQVIAIHSAMLPTGKVLQYAYPSGGSMLWDPVTGQFEPAEVNSDLFCSGHSFLPDGRLLVTGGNRYDCQFQGRASTWIYDPFAQTWTRGEDMADGRWYPTNVELGDGRTLIFTGLGLNCDTNPLIEMYTPGVGIEVIGANSPLPLYPNMHVLSSGRVALVGPSGATYTYDPNGRSWTYVVNTNRNRFRGASPSVLIPGRNDEIMIMGGGAGDGENVTNTCEIIDFKHDRPTWRYTTPMQYARKHFDALILPDKSIFVNGGGLTEFYLDPVRIPELFDPETETWLELPPQTFGRMYHSTTVLLPDGRVLVAGQDSGPGALQGEIYNPSYLYRGPRPVINSAPAFVSYTSDFLIDTQDAASIDSVCMIALTTNTHSINMTQRYVELPFVQNGPDQLRATAPEHGNLAPPGYYMLFIRTADDVPSVAAMVRVGVPAAAPIALVQVITGQLLAGGVPEIMQSDDTFVHTRSGFGATLVDLHHMELQVSAATPVQNAGMMNLSIESRVDQPAATGQARLLNYTTGQYDTVGNFAVGPVDAVREIGGIDATNFVNSGGEIELRIKHIVFVPFLAFTFESWVDWVEIVVE